MATEGELRTRLAEARLECQDLDEEAADLEAQARQARARHRGAVHRYETIQLELEGQMNLFEEGS